MSASVWSIAPLAGRVLYASWQVSVLILLVLFVQWAFQRYLSARWRYALWFLVLAWMVLPTLPEFSLGVYGMTPKPATYFPTVGLSPSLDATVKTDRVHSVRADRSGNPSSRPLSASSVSFPSEKPRGGTAPLGLGWVGLVSGVWFVGAAASMLYVLGQIVSTGFRVRRLPNVKLQETLDLVGECGETIGLRKRLRVVETPADQAPALVGFRQPVLLLPKGVVWRIGRQGLRYVLLHELSHVKRGDVWVNAAAVALSSLHWFNPLVWYALRRIRTDQELACDALSLSHMKPGERQHYVDAILGLLEQGVSSHRVPGVVGVLDGRSQMRRRLRMICEFKPSARASSRVAFLLAALLGLQALTDFGCAVACTPGTNGDGRSEVVAGAHDRAAENGPPHSGRAYVF